MLLRVMYVLLASAMAALGLGLYRATQPSLRRGLPAVLFLVAGVGLATVAIGDSYLPLAAPLLAPLVHGLAAQTAFLCASVAMLLQAWGFGRDARWRDHHALSTGLAWLAFIGLWVHVLWRASPRGLGQKLVTALILLWLLLAARRLWKSAAGKVLPAA